VNRPAGLGYFPAGEREFAAGLRARCVNPSANIRLTLCCYPYSFVDRKNEIGRIARSLQVFKDHLAETTRLRIEQERMKIRTADDRRADLTRIADEFERSIGGMIRGTAAAADELQNSASSMNEIAGSIASAVEEQGAATQEIVRSVQQAALGTQDVMQTIAGVREASGQVDAAATLVLNAAGQLTAHSGQLESETGKFLGNIRAA
jgi:hypothetical protein